MVVCLPHISEKPGRKGIFAVAMLLALGAFLATSGPSQATVLEGQAITFATPTQSSIPTIAVVSEPVNGLGANVAFVHENNDAPRRCAPACLPPQCLKPEGHALRRAPRIVEYQTALDSLSSEEESGLLVTTGPLSEKPGERGAGTQDNSLSSMSPAQASHITLHVSRIPYSITWFTICPKASGS
jgi:hypothetical protein